MSEVPRSSKDSKSFEVTAHVGGWTGGLKLSFGSYESGQTSHPQDPSEGVLDNLEVFQRNFVRSGPKDLEKPTSPHSRSECSRTLREVMRTLFSVRR